MISNFGLNHSQLIVRSVYLDLEPRFPFFKIYDRQEERFCKVNKTTKGKHAEVTNL